MRHRCIDRAPRVNLEQLAAGGIDDIFLLVVDEEAWLEGWAVIGACVGGRLAGGGGVDNEGIVVFCIEGGGTPDVDRVCDEEDGQVADVVDAAVEVGEDLVLGEGKNAGDEVVIEFGEGCGGKDEEAVSGGKGDAGEAGFDGTGADCGSAFAFAEVGGYLAVVEVEGARWAGLGDDCLIAPAAEAGEAEADAMLSDALAVPIGECAISIGEEAAQRAGKAHIQPGEGVPDGRNNMARKRFASRRGAFGNDEEFRTVVSGALAMEDASVGTPVDGFVIDDRELANLQWFGQKGDRPSGSGLDAGNE